MGICLVVHGVTDGTIAEVLNDPPLVWKVLEREDDDAYLDALADGAKQPLLARLFGGSRPAPAPRTLELNPHEQRFVDLDKSWDGLDACLRALRPDTPDFFEGGKSIGSIEVGYGPAKCHDSKTMATIARGWRGVSEDDLLKALQVADFSGRYLEETWRARDDDAAEYLTENFAQLQDFLDHVERHALGTILQFT